MSTSLAMTLAANPGADPGLDDTLMGRVRAGEVEVLAVLFDRYQRRLLHYFFRLGASRGRSSAEDLVQDVFIRVLKYRATYQPGTNFTTWLYHIARNVRLDACKRQRPEEPWNDRYAPPLQPGDAAQATQEQRLLAEALGRLADDKRELIVLCRYQELKQEEVAGLLGCTTGAVKVRLHRAIAELRTEYLKLTRGEP